MNAQEGYIHQVLSRLPGGDLRRQIAMELRSHIAARVEHGGTVEDAIRQLGDPTALAESYLAGIPLVSAPHLRRLFAKLVDFLVIAAVPVALLCGGWLAEGAPAPIGEPLQHPFFMIGALLAYVALFGFFLYPMIAEYRTGQTIGKRLFGLRVVTESGTRITFGQSALRQLPQFLQIFMVDALFTLFTEKRQRAFELVSKTRVVVAQPAGATAGSALAFHVPA